MIGPPAGRGGTGACAHLKIERDDAGGLIVVDLESRGGTRIGGAPLSGRQALSPGADIDMAGVVVRTTPAPDGVWLVPALAPDRRALAATGDDVALPRPALQRRHRDRAVRLTRPRAAAAAGGAQRRGAQTPDSRALDRMKSPRMARRVTWDDARAAETEAPAVDPGLRMERERVRQALTALSPDQRAVVDACYFAGLSTAEAAEKLGCPVGTVKSRLSAARERLRAALADDDAPATAGGTSS